MVKIGRVLFRHGVQTASRSRPHLSSHLSLLVCVLWMAGLVPVVHAEQNAAQRAVDAAKKYAGITLTVHWQAGLQALDPKNYTGPLWEQLTGIKIKVVETPLAEVFVKTLQEYRSGTGSFDVLDVVPSWMPDLARAGALEPLDSYIERFGYRKEIESIAPAFRDNQTKVGGRIFGIPDDGDVFILYYRKDLFGDAQLKTEFQKRFGYPLAPPTTWKQFGESSPSPITSPCSRVVMRR